MFIKIKDISSESVSSLACIFRGAVSSNNRLRLSKKVVNVPERMLDIQINQISFYLKKDLLRYSSSPIRSLYTLNANGEKIARQARPLIQLR